MVSSDVLTRIGMNGEIRDGENDFDHAIARMAVGFKSRYATRTADATKRGILALNMGAEAAARPALRLHACIIGGAGSGGAAPRFCPLPTSRSPSPQPKRPQ